MNDLISRQAARDAIKKLRIAKMLQGEDVTVLWECADVILQLPTASYPNNGRDILKDLDDMPLAEQAKPKEESYEINVCPYCGIDLTED